MARRSYQEGTLEWKRDKPTLRFWERVGPDQWVHRRFYLDEILKGDRRPKRIREAVTQKMAEVNAANNGTFVVVPTVRSFVEEGWQMYLKSCGKEVKESTRSVRDNLIKRHVIGIFGDKSLDAITVAEMTSFFAGLQEKYEASTVYNIYVRCKAIFDAAVEMELIARSPLRETIHRPVVNRNHRKPQLNAEEIQHVFEHVPSEFKPLMLLIAVASLRIGELLGLWWEDFDEPRRLLHVRHTLWQKRRGSPKTEASVKSIPLPAIVVEALRLHRAQSVNIKPTDYIFGWPDGRPYYPQHLLKRVLHPALEQAGIARTKYMHGFHLFRRSCGKLLYEMTHDPKMVQEYLRHSVISTTMDEYVGEVDVVRGEATEMIAKTLNLPLTVPQESCLIQ